MGDEGSARRWQNWQRLLCPFGHHAWQRRLAQISSSCWAGQTRQTSTAYCTLTEEVEAIMRKKKKRETPKLAKDRASQMVVVSVCPRVQQHSNLLSFALHVFVCKMNMCVFEHM